jgi:hypothetical protein
VSTSPKNLRRNSWIPRKKRLLPIPVALRMPGRRLRRQPRNTTPMKEHLTFHVTRMPHPLIHAHFATRRNIQPPSISVPNVEK